MLLWDIDALPSGQLELASVSSIEHQAGFSPHIRGYEYSHDDLSYNILIKRTDPSDISSV